MSQHTITTHRRNGKLQSCEPCRKRKTSCDHKLPSCGRCIKRGVTRDCHYHPAPMTRSGRPDPKSVSPNAPEMTPPTRTYTSIASQDLSIAARRDLPSSSPTRDMDYAGVFHEDTEKAVISPLGFLGESSASAVVAELIDSMGEPQAEKVCAQADDKITEAMVHKGATVLYHLQSLETRLDDLQAQMRVEDGYILFPHAYQVFISDFRRYMRTGLQHVPQGQRLQHLSRLVWRNTFKPMKVSSDTTIEDWARQATGPNLRWETVGLLLSAFGLRVSGAVFSEDHVSHSAANTMSRIDLGKSMLKHVDDCIALCKKCGSCSDLFAVLVYECSPLVEWVRGDVSAEAWVRFGEVCNTAVELGLHKEKHVDARTPFFLCELRIRLFAAIYVHDKYVSTYTGRPPRISYRHCVIQLPTDLSDDEVCSSQAELANALAKLNGGFANSGKLGRATIRRATMAHFIIREEILEIVLGTPQDDASNRIHQIRDKITHSIEEMPPFVRLDPEELLNNVRSGQSFEIPGRKVTWRPLDVCRVLTFHCNLKYTDFLLERALVRRSTVDPAMLVATARSLLNLVMKVTSNSSFLDGFHLYKVELLAFYAIPPAAVLAIELLKHDQLGIDDEALPRSTIIQQLSVLVAALEAVRQDDGNRSMCELGMVALKKVLDRLLSQKRLVVPPVASYHAENIEALFPPTNDMEFLSWLGDVDFDGDLWLDGH